MSGLLPHYLRDWLIRCSDLALLAQLAHLLELSQHGLLVSRRYQRPRCSSFPGTDNYPFRRNHPLKLSLRLRTRVRYDSLTRHNTYAICLDDNIWRHKCIGFRSAWDRVHCDFISESK